MFEFVELQAALDDWPSQPLPALVREELPRLSSALDQAAHEECGAGDLAGLVRDALRSWQVVHRARSFPAPLRVPAGSPWPNSSEWRESGISTVSGLNQDSLRITDVDPWEPPWVRPTRELPLDEFASGRELRRIDDPTPADPVWERGTGFTTYRSLEQREAVRTLLSSAPDATVLVLLPTGSGKSLVGMLQPLVAGPGMISVVVVPTTSLAIDQEIQLRDCLRRVGAPDSDGAFAFHSGLATDVRRDIVTRVHEGGQRVVFASPESLFGPLREALIVGARSGRLGQVVIDEAHMVTTWGADFRPDFQAIGGFREELVRNAAECGHVFRTVLMTATATHRDVATLARLFAPRGRRLVVGGAVALRPELAFEAVRCDDPGVRRVRVQQAVRHLPRPIFVYATLREHVAELEEAVKELGISRVVQVTGESSSADRSSSLDALRGAAGRAPSADIVLATSAFGLGIDVEDVRSVVHACLPESLDRCYQEVGRAGRDGRAAQGLMLWIDEDQPIARNLSEETLVSVPIAQKRWRTMLTSSVSQQRVVWLPMDALRVGLGIASKQNEAWNARTLASMARSGLLRLVGARRGEDEPLQLGVELLRQDLEADDAWKDFEAMRRESRDASAESLAQVLAFAGGEGICDALRDAYSVHDPDLISADLVAHQVCGGCAACSPPGLAPTLGLPLPFRAEDPRIDAAWRAALKDLPEVDGAVFALQSDATKWSRTYRRLVEEAGAAGIRQIITTPIVLGTREIDRAIRNTVNTMGVNAPFVTCLNDDPFQDLTYSANVSTLVLLPPTQERDHSAEVLRRVRDLPPPRVVVMPSTTQSPLRADMTMADLYPSAITAFELVERLAQCRS